MTRVASPQRTRMVATVRAILPAEIPNTTPRVVRETTEIQMVIMSIIRAGVATRDRMGVINRTPPAETGVVLTEGNTTEII